MIFCLLYQFGVHCLEITCDVEVFVTCSYIQLIMLQAVLEAFKCLLLTKRSLPYGLGWSEVILWETWNLKASWLCWFLCTVFNCSLITVTNQTDVERVLKPVQWCLHFSSSYSLDDDCSKLSEHSVTSDYWYVFCAVGYVARRSSFSQWRLTVHMLFIVNSSCRLQMKKSCVAVSYSICLQAAFLVLFS